MSVLVTGGLGYIGSHCVIELLECHFDVIVIDNLSNSKLDVISKIQNITGKKIKFYQIDLLDLSQIDKIFQKNQIGFVVHLAALKSVNQSIDAPLYYYSHNLTVTLNLLSVMSKYNVKKLIYSSSATVYGSEKSPVDEKMETGKNLTNPYAKTKYMTEEILKDLYKSDNNWSIVILRYFNPSGAHQSGLIGENPNDIPNNLMPYLLKVADGIFPVLKIYGSDYDTTDGTCVRDFIHIVDLAKGHIATIKCLNETGIYIYNLGTGKDHTVKEIVETFKKINNIKLPYVYTDRRPGDIEISYASVSKAKQDLNWTCEHNIADICRDSWYAYQCSKN
ncbi:UDP-glucose 4-epimerase GalE [Tupanvirus deep ocean]|uniref:UDP-glucose 4-epimerase GalE n=2 Tax=Tupanvirus TaxID=2094720 RepID=A0AC62A9I0_9VIRU|nr:UDP-glucose 4-epimerase GalE [Tupanvirus deep ocean]QKU34332.1 UDP-glucose 4-epimerase GalE [Tupanvirus deep ocean]